MKFACDRRAINELLKMVGRAIAPKPSHPILGNFLLVAEAGKLTVTGYDLTMGIVASIPVEVEVEGSVCVPAALTLDILSHMPDEQVTFERNGGDFQIAVSDGKCRLSCTDITDYPDLPCVDSEPISFLASSLVDGVRQCLYAVSPDEAKQVLTGFQITIKDCELTIAAVDGHRIATVSCAVESGGEMDAIVPARALREVERLAGTGQEIDLYCDGKVAAFQVGERRLISNLLQGKFPDFKVLIPTSFASSVSTDRKKLLSTIERFKAFSSKNHFTVKMILEPPDMVRLDFEAQDTGSANSSLASQVEGEPLALGLSIHYLIEALKAIQTDEVFIRIAEPSKPIAIRPVGAVATHVIMPIQLRS